MNNLINTWLDPSLIVRVGEISRSGIARSKGVYVLKAFAIYCQSSFQKECMSLYAASSVWHAPVSS